MYLYSIHMQFFITPTNTCIQSYFRPFVNSFKNIKVYVVCGWSGNRLMWRLPGSSKIPRLRAALAPKPWPSPSWYQITHHGHYHPHYHHHSRILTIIWSHLSLLYHIGWHCPHDLLCRCYIKFTLSIICSCELIIYINSYNVTKLAFMY